MNTHFNLHNQKKVKLSNAVDKLNGKIQMHKQQPSKQFYKQIGNSKKYNTNFWTLFLKYVYEN